MKTDLMDAFTITTVDFDPVAGEFFFHSGGKRFASADLNGCLTLARNLHREVTLSPAVVDRILIGA